MIHMKNKVKKSKLNHKHKGRKRRKRLRKKIRKKLFLKPLKNVKKLEIKSIFNDYQEGTKIKKELYKLRKESLTVVWKHKLEDR